MNRLNLVLTSLLFVVSTLWAINGTVIDEKGSPLENVAVQILKQDTTVYTDYYGYYHKYTQVSILSTPEEIRKNDFVFTGNGFTLSLDQAAQISISIHNARGQAVFTHAEKMSPGLKTIGTPPLAHGLYFAKVQIGTKQFSQKLMINSMNHSTEITSLKSTRNSTNITPPYVEALDSLLFTKEGYIPVTIAIRSYKESIDTVVMTAEPSGSVIECNSLTLGYNRDNFPANRKDTVLLNLSLRNSGTENALSVSCSLSTSDNSIIILNPVVGFNNITAGESTEGQSLYKVLIPRNQTPWYTIPFKLDIKDSWGGEWSDNVEYMPYPFSVEMQNIDDDTIPDSYGDGNGEISINETIEYTPKIRNNSSNVVENLSGELMNNISFTVSPNDRQWNFGTMNCDESKLPEYDFVFSVENDSVKEGGMYYSDMLLTGTVDGKSVSYLLPISMKAAETKVVGAESMFNNYEKYEIWAYDKYYTEYTEITSGPTQDALPITVAPSPWESWMKELSFMVDNTNETPIGDFDSLVISYSTTDEFALMFSEKDTWGVYMSDKSLTPGNTTLTLTPENFEGFTPELTLFLINGYDINPSTELIIHDILIYRGDEQ